MNDQEKGSVVGRVLRFIGERSFYFILLACVLVISLAAWAFSAAMESTKPVQEPELQTRVTAPPENGSVTYTWMPAVTPAPTEVPKQEIPEEEPQPTEAAAETEAEESQGAAEVMATAFNWPLWGDVVSGYSVDALQYDRTMGDWRTHAGIDISGDLGEKVRSAADGTVERVYTDEMYGVTVVLYHGGGLRSVYCNLAGTPAVQAGDSVSLGQVIGAVGSTADAEVGEVNHLHFAMTLDEARVDPMEYLPER